MRKLDRESLSESAAQRFQHRTRLICESAAGLTPDAARFQARKNEAKRLWDKEGTLAFDEIEERLKRMSPGDGQCMYCESGEASHIDHFWPRAAYPDRTYDWSNYLWACAVCNSNYKRDQFPLDSSSQPLLLNPVDDEPRDHLELSPGTGKYVGLTHKGDESIRVFGLSRRKLEQSRRDAWLSVQLHVMAYAVDCQGGEHGSALEMQRVLCRSPHASVFLKLPRMLGTDDAKMFIRPACIAAINAHPEIRSWV